MTELIKAKLGMTLTQAKDEKSVLDKLFELSSEDLGELGKRWNIRYIENAKGYCLPKGYSGLVRMGHPVSLALLAKFISDYAKRDC